MVVSSLSLRHPSSLNFVRLLGAGNLVWVGTNWWERSRPQAHHAVPSPRAGRHWPLWTVPGKTAKNFLERQQAWVQCMEQHHLGQGCSGWAGERQTPWESCPASFWGSPPYRYPLGPSHGLALESTPVNKALHIWAPSCAGRASTLEGFMQTVRGDNWESRPWAHGALGSRASASHPVAQLWPRTAEGHVAHSGEHTVGSGSPCQGCPKLLSCSPKTYWG